MGGSVMHEVLHGRTLLKWAGPLQRGRRCYPGRMVSRAHHLCDATGAIAHCGAHVASSGEEELDSPLSMRQPLTQSCSTAFLAGNQESLPTHVLAIPVSGHSLSHRPAALLRGAVPRAGQGAGSGAAGPAGKQRGLRLLGGKSLRRRVTHKAGILADLCPVYGPGNPLPAGTGCPSW